MRILRSILADAKLVNATTASCCFFRPIAIGKKQNKPKQFKTDKNEDNMENKGRSARMKLFENNNEKN